MHLYIKNPIVINVFAIYYNYKIILCYYSDPFCIYFYKLFYYNFLNNSYKLSIKLNIAINLDLPLKKDEHISFWRVEFLLYRTLSSERAF